MGKQIVSKFDSHQKLLLKKKGGKSLPNKSKKIRKKISKTEDFQAKLEELKAKERSLECQDLKPKILIHPTSKKQYLALTKRDGDLFSHEDLIARPDQFTNFSFIHILFDEIMLEGLEGITLEALWKRINYTLKVDRIPIRIQELLWNFICLNERIKMYELPSPRDDLVLPKIEEEIYSGLPQIYSTEIPQKNAATYVDWGCCNNLNQRVDISTSVRTMSLQRANTFGNLLVLVADADLRKNVLLGEIADPVLEILPNDYCLLEIIGRSRDYGKTTLGPAALHHDLKIDSRTLFLQTQRLVKEHVLTKQYFFDKFVGYDEKVKSGRLYHLRRFYFRRQSRYQVILENIVDYLKKCPGFRAPYRTVKAQFFSDYPKVRKFPEFIKLLDTSLKMPVREVFKSVEDMIMNGIRPRETTVQLIRLKDPFVNVQASWRYEVQGDESPDEDEDDEGESDLKTRRFILNRDLLRDVYLYILSRGNEGAVTAEVHRHFEWDFSFARVIIKRLCSRNLVKVTKRDNGSQTTNHYVAIAALANPNIQTNQKINRPHTSKALEKLKMRQKKKIESVPKELVYTLEQYESDQSLDKVPKLPVQISFPVPKIVCQFLIPDLPKDLLGQEFNIYLLEMHDLFKPFTIKLTIPSVAEDIPRIILEVASNESSNNPREGVVFLVCTSEVCCLDFKPSYFTKAFLLKSLLDKTRINTKEVLDLLSIDNGQPKEPQKRPREEIQIDLEPDDIKSVKMTGGKMRRQISLNDAMGEEILIDAERHEASGVIMEVYSSKPKRTLKTGDINNYIVDPNDTNLTERSLNRIKFVLKYMQEVKVLDNINILTREIQDYEAKDGYIKKIDKRTLWRIYQKLVAEGYVVIFKIVLHKSDFKRIHTYVCHPDISLDNSILQLSLATVKEMTINQECLASAAGSARPAKKEETIPERSSQGLRASYFTGAEILKSVTEMKEMTKNANKPLRVRMSSKMGRFYGRKPKFASLAILHELIFYLVYELDRKTQPISEEEVINLFQSYKINLTETDLANLPPIYCKEISWRTFIPPLPVHWQWEEGWMLLADVILRMPILLISQCHTINFICDELQAILQHPIKRLYQLRYVPAPIQNLLSNRRRLIQGMHNQMIMLGYLGLVQFGPSTFNDRNKSFFYINRKATLWDTTSSEPGFFTIEDKEYPKLHFIFTKTEDVLNFWTTMHQICTSTNLTNRSAHIGERYTIIDPASNPTLAKSRVIRTYQDAPKYDIGELPGDHKGAGGLDSCFWPHLRKSWVFLIARNCLLFAKSFDTLKFDDLVDSCVNFDHLKLVSSMSGQKMLPPEKYFMSRQVLSKALPPKTTRRDHGQRPTKKAPVLKKTVMPRRELKVRTVRYDAIDRALKRKYPLRYRPKWSADEDRIVILMKIADIFVSPGTYKQMVSYATMRDLLHLVCPASRDKNSKVLQNRLKVLRKTVNFLGHGDQSQAQFVISNLIKLPVISQYFLPFRTKMLEQSKRIALFRYSKDVNDFNTIFIYLMDYLLKHQKEVQNCFEGNYANIDYFNDENLSFYKDQIVPFHSTEVFYKEPKNQFEVRRSTLQNTVHGALVYKKEHSLADVSKIISLQAYKVYQRFSNEILKHLIEEMRRHRMIQMRKRKGASFLHSYRLSLHYVTAQNVTWWYESMESAYNTFLDLKYDQPMNFYADVEFRQRNKFGQLLGVNEALSFIPLDDVVLDIKFPEYHLILNPDIKDHSEVVDEIAKRYHAKFLSETKESEKATDSSQRIEGTEDGDDDDVEMIEIFEPHLSTSKQQPEPVEKELETIHLDEDEGFDLSISAKESAAIDNLKHWISDCIDLDRVRSPSPELLNLDFSKTEIKTEQEESIKIKEENDEPKKLLSKEEIIEEMLKPSTSCKEPRAVPYISDLVRLLFINYEDGDFKTDDLKSLALIKKHFVKQYPAAEKISLRGIEGHYLADYVENRSSIKDVWIRVERESYVGSPSDKSVALDEIYGKGGDVQDLTTAYEMLQYVEEQGLFGATGYELKEKFINQEGRCSLELILKILTDHYLLLRTGVCSVRYIHFKHREPWLTETFRMNVDLMAQLSEGKLSDNHLDWYNINPFPWTNIEGTFDRNVFKVWMSNVFSYCIEHVKITFTDLCAKFCYLKPFDVFYLVEKLQELGALELRRYFLGREDIFSEYQLPEESLASPLDRFEDMYIETNNIGFTMLGSFFHSI